MRVAYAIVSHRNPDQVLRLVRALREGPGAHVFVRHDQARTPLPPSELKRAGAAAVEPDYPVEWGAPSQLRALLDAIAAAATVDPDWLLVLSGQDYPLRPLAEIERDLAAARVDAFLGDAWALDTSRFPPPPQLEFFLRYAYRHFRAPRGLRPPARLRRLVYLREPPGQKPLVGIRRLRPRHDLHVSADWPTLRRPAIAAVLRAAREDARLMRFYCRGWIASESFFATVLLNDPELRVETQDRRFVRFTGGAAHPDTFTRGDLERLIASGCDFARKFDATLNADVLDLLDERRRSATPR